MSLHGITASAHRISRQLRFDLRLKGTAFSPAPLISRRCGCFVIETFRFLPHDPATDETLERAQRSLIFRRNETDRIADGVRTTGAPDAMNIILRVHREIVIHHVRNSIDVDTARSNVGRDQNADGAGLEIFQRAQPLILRSIRMNRARRDPAGLELARDLIGAALGPGKNENGIELRIGKQMQQERGLQVRREFRKPTA